MIRILQRIFHLPFFSVFRRGKTFAETKRPVETAHIVKTAFFCNIRDFHRGSLQKRGGIFKPQTVDILTEIDQQFVTENIGYITSADREIFCDLGNPDILRKMTFTIRNDLFGFIRFEITRAELDLLRDQQKNQIDKRTLDICFFLCKTACEIPKHICDPVIIVVKITDRISGNEVFVNSAALRYDIRLEYHNDILSASVTILIIMDAIGEGNKKHSLFHVVFFPFRKRGKTAAQCKGDLNISVNMRGKIRLVGQKQDRIGFYLSEHDTQNITPLL